MNRQSGLSLVELMIALLIGSLLVIAATQLFLVNRQTENLQLGIAGVQDNGRFAFDYVSRSLMESGQGGEEPIVPFILDGSGFSGTPADAEITDGAKFDSIAFEIVGGRDCVGNEFTGYKRFYVADDAEGTRLMCMPYQYSETEDEEGNVSGGWSATNTLGFGLFDNIEAFQVLYGLDFDGPDSDGYGLADLFTNATRTKALRSDISNGDVRIVSVRFSVMLASDEVVSLDTTIAPDSIEVLDQTFVQGADNAGTNINFEDGRLYRTYGTTVAIRNLVRGI